MTFDNYISQMTAAVIISNLLYRLEYLSAFRLLIAQIKRYDNQVTIIGKKSPRKPAINIACILTHTNGESGRCQFQSINQVSNNNGNKHSFLLSNIGASIHPLELMYSKAGDMLARQQVPNVHHQAATPRSVLSCRSLSYADRPA